ncbi:hypothetical protein B0J12DRAFT_702612 [Macrophomina phaseolina]|uniref:Uncharacterized protein n=1 Tax=Macrophomina phaseolina TaxID=35725 RepID=A0ABQ8G112_9PEZI|nr:hypothetical protein B0J12DRAFT_702612 [Macrophomina phaseolina]
MLSDVMKLTLQDDTTERQQAIIESRRPSWMQPTVLGESKHLVRALRGTFSPPTYCKKAGRCTTGNTPGVFGDIHDFPGIPPAQGQEDFLLLGGHCGESDPRESYAIATGLSRSGEERRSGNVDFRKTLKRTSDALVDVLADAQQDTSPKLTSLTTANVSASFTPDPLVTAAGVVPLDQLLVEDLKVVIDSKKHQLFDYDCLEAPGASDADLEKYLVHVEKKLKFCAEQPLPFGASHSKI